MPSEKLMMAFILSDTNLLTTSSMLSFGIAKIAILHPSGKVFFKLAKSYTGTPLIVVPILLGSIS